MYGGNRAPDPKPNNMTFPAKFESNLAQLGLHLTQLFSQDVSIFPSVFLSD